MIHISWMSRFMYPNSRGIYDGFNNGTTCRRSRRRDTDLRRTDFVPDEDPRVFTTDLWESKVSPMSDFELRVRRPQTYTKTGSWEKEEEEEGETSRHVEVLDRVYSGQDPSEGLKGLVIREKRVTWTQCNTSWKWIPSSSRETQVPHQS